MESAINFDDALFTYIISDHDCTLFQNHHPIFNKTLILHHTTGTEVLTCQDTACEITVIGLCVDTHGELSREDIPAYLLGFAGQGIQSVYEHAARFSGKYVLCCQCADGRYLFGDATGSVEINYALSQTSFCAASVSQLVAKQFHYAVSEYAQAIRSGSDYSQALPNDLTMFDEIKVLLPNHYLDIANRQVVRVPLCPISPDLRDNVNDVVDRSIPLIENTLRAYHKYYKIVCPLTSGYDSRIVFSFLKDEIPDLTCYTFLHRGFTEETDDIKVPRLLCQAYQKQHIIIPDLKAPDAYVSDMEAIMGSYCYRGTIDLAYTYLSVFRGCALVNGDIIDQVGKSLLGNRLAPRYGTAAYFQCKLHNFSKQAKEELERYLSDVRRKEPADRIFDLFAIENRCGRWAAQGGSIYSLASIPSLNLFNSRELICLWASLDRKHRVQEQIHKGIFMRKDPGLLRFPFNPSDRTGYLKKNPYLFLAATYGKYVLQLFRK